MKLNLFSNHYRTFISRPVEFTFLYLLILQLISNTTWLYIVHPFSWVTLLFIIMLSTMTAGILSLPIKIFKRKKSIILIYIGIISLLQLILIAVDYFLLLNFSIILVQDVVDIIYESNPTESVEFISTYLSPLKTLFYLAALVAIMIISAIIAKLLCGINQLKYVSLGLMVGGAVIMGYTSYSYVRFRNGNNIPQLISLTRVAYSCYKLRKSAAENNKIYEECRNFLTDKKLVSQRDSLTVVLVIGESHSYYHTPAYGYDKNNMPLLSQRTGNDTIVWFNDIVAISDRTHGVVCSLFEHDLTKDSHRLLFPAVFKKLGYHTIMYDTQYLPGRGVSILRDSRISELLYDERNSHTMTDEEIVTSGNINSNPKTLAIYHIMGSHYTYSQRYPKDKFDKFKPQNYKSARLSSMQKLILSHYDNSILYTDNNLNLLIERLKDKNAVLVYLSDHGEEVFDIDSYMGHGNAATRSSKSFQLRVPMFIWMSEKYRHRHPELADMVSRSADIPSLSSQIGHLLLNLAGEPDSMYQPNCSLINPAFEKGTRIVLNFIDFDANN